MARIVASTGAAPKRSAIRLRPRRLGPQDRRRSVASAPTGLPRTNPVATPSPSRSASLSFQRTLQSFRSRNAGAIFGSPSNRENQMDLIKVRRVVIERMNESLYAQLAPNGFARTNPPTLNRKRRRAKGRDRSRIAAALSGTTSHRTGKRQRRTNNSETEERTHPPVAR